MRPWAPGDSYLVGDVLQAYQAQVLTLATSQASTGQRPGRQFPQWTSPFLLVWCFKISRFHSAHTSHWGWNYTGRRWGGAVREGRGLGIWAPGTAIGPAREGMEHCPRDGVVNGVGRLWSRPRARCSPGGRAGCTASRCGKWRGGPGRGRQRVGRGGRPALRGGWSHVGSRGAAAGSGPPSPNSYIPRSWGARPTPTAPCPAPAWEATGREAGRRATRRRRSLGGAGSSVAPPIGHPQALGWVPGAERTGGALDPLGRVFWLPRHVCPTLVLGDSRHVSASSDTCPESFYLKTVNALFYNPRTDTPPARFDFLSWCPCSCFSFIVGMYKVLKTHFLNYTCSLHYTVLESLLNWLLSLIAVANWGISETWPLVARTAHYAFSVCQHDRRLKNMSLAT